MPRRQKLLRGDWPEPDRAMWEALVRPGGLFEECGPLSQWRPRSLRSLEETYGLWLAWITAQDPAAMALAPQLRASPERVLAWMTGMGKLQPITRLTRFRALCQTLGAGDPSWQSKAHRRIERQLRSAALDQDSPRKQGRILAGEDLYRHLSREMAALSTKTVSREIACDVRDVTLLLFLTLLPLRRRNLAELTVGKDLLQDGASWRVDLPASETKTHRAFTASLPVPLSDAVSRYVWDYRPLILAANAADSGALWIGDRGHPWSPHTLALRVGKLTRQRFGVAISPHLFRDSAVTTMILGSPEQAALAAALLGHHSAETSRRHYLQARQIEAARTLQSRIDQIKRVHR